MAVWVYGTTSMEAKKARLSILLVFGTICIIGLLISYVHFKRKLELEAKETEEDDMNKVRMSQHMADLVRMAQR